MNNRRVDGVKERAMESDSTFRLSTTSVRESAESILAVTRSVVSGNVFTIDRLAVRLWSTNKQIKALHFTETDIQIDVIGLEYISKIDGFAGLLQIVKINDENPPLYTVCRVWSSTLNVLCQISFPGLKFSCISFNAKQDAFCVVERGRKNVRLMSFASTQQQPQAPMFPKASHHGIDSSHNSLVELHSLPRWKCEIREESNCAFERPDGFKTAAFYRTNVIIVLSETSLHLYLRTPSDDDTGISFANFNTFPFSDLWTDQTVAHPTCMHVYDNDKLVIGFRDGRIRVLLCVDDFNSERKPTILFDFQSNSDQMYPVTCVSVAPWSVNSEGIAFEIISLNGGYIMSHWRLQLHRKDYTPKQNRSEFLEKKKSQFLGYSHLLSETTLGKGSQQKSRAETPASHLVAYEHELGVDPTDIAAVDDPGSRRKKVVTTFDGLLLAFDVHEPHRTVINTQQEIVQTAMQVSNGACHFVTLHADEVRLLSTPVKPSPNGAPPVASEYEPQSAGVTISNSALGYPTALCFGGNGIYVGFSRGNVQCFGYADGYLASVRVAVDTTIIHTTAIRKLITVIVSRPVSTGLDRMSASATAGSDEKVPGRLVLLVVGDDKGILSVWRISEKRNVKPKEANKTLQWAAHAHLGAIFYASSSSVNEFAPATTNIIITGCDRGLVKCWILQPSGKLALSAFFNSSPSLSAIVCIAVHDNLQSSSPFGRSLSVANTGHPGVSIARPSTISYLCLCGDSFGMVESRLLSNDQGKASQRPVRTLHVFGSPISKMCLVAADVTDDRVQHCGERSLVLCASIDGSVTFLELDESGYFRRAGLYFSVPFSPLNVLQYNSRMLMVSADQIVEIRKFDTSMSNTVDGGFQSGRMEAGVPASSDDDGGSRLLTFSESSGSRGWEEESYPDNASIGSRQEISSASKHYVSRGGAATDGIIVQRRKLIADISSAIPGVDMQSTRKDGRLLELFKQYDSDGRHTLTRANAVSLISNWLKIDVEIESINHPELARVLSFLHDPIFNNDEVQFLELATLAAAARAVHRRVNLPSRKWLEYSSMMNTKRAVSYGVMGEMQENQRQLVHGDPRGRSATFSHVVYRVLGREVLEATAMVEAAEPPTLLSAIPLNLKPFIGKVQLPASWSSSNKYYLDVRRTVRIIRTVLDTRGAMSATLDEGFISNQVVEYFQTNYGAASLDVAGDKILNFLEALLQYTNIPVVNSLRRLIFEEEESCGELFPNKMALSYYLRTRTYLYSRGYVVPGDFLPRDGAVGGFGDYEPVSGDTFAVPRRQLVSRLHIFECMQSTFESAHFGPSAVQRLFAMTKLLPSVVVDFVHSSKLGSAAADLPPRGSFADYVDCENFLDIMLVEIDRVVTMVDDLKQIAFAGNQFDLSLVALPDNIPMPDAAFLQQVVHTNGLMHRFISLDPDRTGRVNSGLFREHVLRISQSVDESNEVALNFVEECLSRFRCGKAGDEVSYLDLWATILSYLVQKDDLSGGPIANHAGYVETNFPIWALAALVGLKRGLDENRASALVALLGYMPFLSNGDSFKSLDSRGRSCGGTEGEPQLDLHVPHNGVWTLPAVPELASGDPGGIYLTAAKFIKESNSGAVAHRISVVDDVDDLPLRKRKPTMLELLRPSSKHTSKVLLDVADGPVVAHGQAKTDLHPVVLMVPLVATAQDGGKHAERESTRKIATYAKSYSRSVNSLDSKLIDAMHDYRRTVVAEVEGLDEERLGVMNAPSGLRVTTQADVAEDFAAKDRHETITCNEIEQLRIAQLVRQHDVLNKLEHEQDLLRKRREKRNIDAQLLTKRDRRQPKKRKPLTVCTEQPERAKEPPKKVAIAVPTKEKVKHPAAKSPVPAVVLSSVQPATVASVPLAPATGKTHKPPSMMVTLSAEVPPIKPIEVAKPAPTELHPASRPASRALTPATPVALEPTTPGPGPASSRVAVSDADNNADNDVDAVSVDVDDASRALSKEEDPVEQPDDDDEADDDADAVEDDVADGEVAPDEESADSISRSSLGQSAAVLRVETPLVWPSRVAALVAPRVEREEELNREEFESAQMEGNDFDSPSRIAQLPATMGVPAADEPPGEEEYYSSSDGTAASEEKLSYAEKRIRILKKKLEEAKSGYHPRRNDEEMAGVAFFPMLFSDDLVYNPCSSSCGPLVSTQSGDDTDALGTVPDRNESPEARIESAPSADDFSDIRKVVDERKAQLLRERLLQLYKNSSTAITEEWVSVVRKKGVDWESYMQQEKGSRLQQAQLGSGKTRLRPKAGTSPRPITSANQLQSPGPLPGGHVAAALAVVAAMNAADDSTSTSAKDDPGAVANAEEDEFFLRRIEDHEERLRKAAAAGADSSDIASPMPVALPFGKVISGICEIDVAMYFYVQVTSPDSVVTIELQCAYGFADVYSASDSIPTTVHFEHRAACTLENAKLGRITTKVSGGDHVCILVHSRSTGATFTLWAYETGKMSIEVPAVKRTIKFVKAFNCLIENNEEELGTFLPRLLYEAHRNVELQDEKELADTAVFRRHHNATAADDGARARPDAGNASSRESIVGNSGSEAGDSAPLPSSLLLDEDGEDIVERYIYRKSITLLRGDPTINPNVDAQLMLPCLLPRKELPTGAIALSAPIIFPKIQVTNRDEFKSKLKKLGGTPKKLNYKLTTTKTDKEDDIQH